VTLSNAGTGLLAVLLLEGVLDLLAGIFEIGLRLSPLPSAAPISVKGLGSSGYRTALRPWAAKWKSQVPRGAERLCTSASHSAASDAECKKRCSIRPPGRVAGYRASLHPQDATVET
jgi:hypothetical protein